MSYLSSICVSYCFASYVVELHLSIFYKQLPYSQIQSDFLSMSALFSYFVEDFLENGVDCFFRGTTDLSEGRLAHLDLLHFLI